MSKNAYIAIAALVVIVAGGWLVLQRGAAPEQSAPEEQTQVPAESGQTQEPSSNTVVYTSSGFSPRELNISQGETVTFRNGTSREIWPATAIHPTHTIYPGSDIRNCGSPEAENMFDACGPVAPGEAWSFTFEEQGSWAYHDHLQAGNTGRIIVR